MRRATPLSWFRLSWPRSVEFDQLAAATRALYSIGGLPVTLVVRGADGDVEHFLGVPPARREDVGRHLRAAVAGLELVATDQTSENIRLVLDIRASTGRRPLAPGDPEVITKGLLTALASTRINEVALVSWRLVEHVGPVTVPNQISPLPESWLRALATAPLGSPPPLDAESRAALKAKRSEPAWKAVGRIAVRTSTDSRSRGLATHVLGALRAAESPGVRLTAKASTASSLDGGRARSGSVVNIAELPVLAGWPLGPTESLPIRRARSRRLQVSRAVPSEGRVIGDATNPGSTVPVALSPEDSLRHVHVLGPTGVGKSTLLLNLITQDMGAGRGLVVVEPKGDLIADVLARVPENRVDDVVLLDPTEGDAVVGLNPLSTPGMSSELTADQLLSVFHALYAASWGPRTQDILHASLLTLARRTGSSLVELPLLLTDAGFRRRVVGQLDEPVVLEPFWAGFEAWTEAQRTEAIAPVLNKVRPFLLRSSLRTILGQAQPRFEIQQVFTKRKIFLVNLAKGAMGGEAAALLGSLVVAQLWRATLERSRLEPQRRHPVFVFIDEFQDYLHLPTDLADALAAARGLGVGLVMAHQHLHQLGREMRSAVLANARSRICFQLSAEDARLIAGGASRLDAEDLQNLDAFEIYAQLVASGSVQPWLSARTRPAPPTSATRTAVTRRSRELYGCSRAEVDRALRDGRRSSAPNDIGVKPDRGSA